MLKESDLVQGSARAFAERLISERFAAVIAQQTDAPLKETLQKLYHLYLLTLMENNLGQFVCSGLLPAKVSGRDEGMGDGATSRCGCELRGALEL